MSAFVKAELTILRRFTFFSGSVYNVLIVRIDSQTTEFSPWSSAMLDLYRAFLDFSNLLNKKWRKGLSLKSRQLFRLINL